MLLSRVANALYWMSRYIERAENIARFIDVNTQLTLDRSSREEQWLPLVSITGDEDEFLERYGDPTRAAVTRFLTLDRDYHNSVASCIAAARENARTVRETITSEMWKQINQLHLMVQRIADRGFVDDRPADFYTNLKNGTLLFAGITDATMSHNMAWDFCRLGRMIERADKTSRILDVKYFLLLPRPEDVGTALDAVQWGALLRSVGGLEMYRRHHGAIAPAPIAAFLVLNPEFPRSIMHCLLHGEDALRDILGPGYDPASYRAARGLGRIRAELEFGDIHEIIGSGLHDFLDNFQARLNAFDVALNEAVFHLTPSRPPNDFESEDVDPDDLPHEPTYDESQPPPSMSQSQTFAASPTTPNPR